MLALLPREAVGAPSLEAFRSRLEVTLGSLSWWGGATLTKVVSIASSDFCGSCMIGDAFENIAKGAGEGSEDTKLSLCFYLSRWND